MSITDKELLTFCNLANLEMEYANVIKGYRSEQKYNEVTKKNEEIKIPINHTIYSLLDKEMEGIEKRIELTQNYTNNEQTSNKDLGSFYDIDNDNLKEYRYAYKSTLRREAPIIMEYYDRYKVSKDKFSHEGKFIEEWEVIGSYDKYKLAKERYDNIQKSLGSKKKFPTRSEIEKNQVSELIMKFFVIGYTIALNMADSCSIFEIPPFKGKAISFLSQKNLTDKYMEEQVIKIISDMSYGKILKNESIKEVVVGTPGTLLVAMGRDDSIDKLFFNEIKGSLANANMINAINFDETNKITLELEDLFNFSQNKIDDDFRVVILRKKNGNKDEIVMSISKKYFEDLNTQLNKSELPKNMKYILQLINSIQYKYETEKKEYNLTLTGIDEAGKVANILSTLTGCQVKGFFTNEPKNIANSVDFSENDLGFFSEKLNYFPSILVETLSTGAEFKGGIGALENFIKEGTVYSSIYLVPEALLLNPCFCAIYTSFLIYKYLKNFLEVSSQNRKIEQIFYKLGNNRIIKNVLEKEVEREIIGNYSIIREKPVYFINNKIGGEVDLNIRDALKNNSKYVLANGIDLNSYLMKIACEDLELVYTVGRILYFLKKENEDLIIINLDGGFKTYSRRKYWTVEKHHYPYQVVQEVKKSVHGVEKEFRQIYSPVAVKNENKYYTDETLNNPIDVNEIPNPKGDPNLETQLMEEIKNINPLSNYEGKHYIEDENAAQEERAIYNHLVNALIFYGTFQENFKKRIKENRSYGVYMKGENLFLEKKYSLEKEEEEKVSYLTKEYSLEKIEENNENEYIFFPFIQKDGNLQNVIRDEYLCTVVRTGALSEILEEEYKWNIDLNDENENKNEKVPRVNHTTKEKILKKLKVCRFELKNRVIELIKKNSIDRYKIVFNDETIDMVVNKFGIMREDKSYDVEKIGYIYNRDNLRGRLACILESQVYPNDINKYFVYNGTKLKCSVGEGESRIIADYQATKVYESNYYATEEDCKPNINILPFESCPNCESGKCEIENIEGKWLNNSNKSEIINGSALLSSDSIMKCKKGGVLSFVNVKGVVGKS